MRDVACCRFASSSTPRYCNCAGCGSSPRFWRPRIRVTVLSVRCENLCACLVLLLRILQSCRGRLTWQPPFPRFLVNVFVENPPRFVRLLFVSVLVFPGAGVVIHTSPCWRACLVLFPFFFFCDKVLFSCFIGISSPDCANALWSLRVGFSC